MEGRGRQHLRWRLENIRQMKIHTGMRCRTAPRRGECKWNKSMQRIALCLAESLHITREFAAAKEASQSPRDRLFAPFGRPSNNAERATKGMEKAACGSAGYVKPRVSGSWIHKHRSNKAGEYTFAANYPAYDCFKRSQMQSSLVN